MLTEKHTIHPRSLIKDSLIHCLDSMSKIIATNNHQMPMQPINNGLSTGDWIAIIIFILGVIGTGFALVWKAGNIGGKIIEKMTNISETLTEIKKDTFKIPILEIQVTTMWSRMYSENKSPVVLNATGVKILEDSGIKKIVEEKYDLIKDYVEKEKNPKNAYEVQEAVKEAVSALRNDASLVNRIEDGAYKSGTDVFAVLFIGAIYIRDRVLTDLGYDIGDIDRHSPAN